METVKELLARRITVDTDQVVKATGLTKAQALRELRNLSSQNLVVKQEGIKGGYLSGRCPARWMWLPRKLKEKENATH